MKTILLIITILFFALNLPAQTNAPARLALIAETADASAAVDVLTAQLSGNKNLQLLERNEIEKVYREQGLSAGNKDYLKLGQILGADGLLLLETATEGTNHVLNIRLIAVKPGVVLIAEKFSWPVVDLTEWSAAFANHLNPLLPKLTVLVKDAIPISVVNLRSAISSADGAETERQLKLLTIQRLSLEPQFFVLERQKMQLLAEEKDLKLDDSAFWNGSYLLEGVVDQNGYSKDTITINARLTPPKGGAPVLIEISGARANPRRQQSAVTGSTWMCFLGDNLYIGQEETLGVWAIPIADIEAAIEAQKQIQIDRQTQSAAAVEQIRKTLLAKYDRSHNGILDPEEKEGALDDPVFIESELDVIDANHNGWLGAEELVYFDANKNKILEPKEQAGIEIAQHLLAERLLKKFDANGDGWLDRPEFNDLVQSDIEPNARTLPGMQQRPFPDENHDGHIDLGELETFLNQQARRGLRSRGMPVPASINQMNLGANQPVDPRQIFKALVEFYWQNPGGVINPSPRNNTVPGADVVPNRTPQGAPQQ